MLNVRFIFFSSKWTVAFVCVDVASSGGGGGVEVEPGALTRSARLGASCRLAISWWWFVPVVEDEEEEEEMLLVTVSGVKRARVTTTS
jgi:hypothetical protein